MTDEEPLIEAPPSGNPMSYLFPDWLTTDDPDTPLDLDGLINDSGTRLKLTILVKNPTFAGAGDVESDAPGTTTVDHITSVETLTELLENPAWQSVDHPLWHDQEWHDDAEDTDDAVALDYFTQEAPRVGQWRVVRTTGGEIGSTFYYWPKSRPCIATGYILSLVTEAPFADFNDRILMIFRTERPLYLSGESEDLSTQIGAESGWLTYSERTGVNNSLGWNIAPGDPGVTMPTLDWEPSRSVHVWIDPQRINYIMDPSFRYETAVGWRTNATFGHVDAGGGIVRDGVSECAHLTGESPIVLESNLFPTNSIHQTWCVSAEVSGVGRFRVGIVFFQATMADSEAMYVCTPWERFGSGSHHQSDFHRIYASLPTPETVKEGLVRIEFEGTECWIDEVLAAPEDGPGTYFDAQWPMGQPGDYTWYGVEENSEFANQSYSLFYNNRKSLDSMMFGFTTVQGPSPNHNEVVVRGEASKWVPEGVNIVPHWDDVFSERVHTWMDDVLVPPKDYVHKDVVTNLSHSTETVAPVASADTTSPNTGVT